MPARHCASCGEELPQDASPRARFCGNTCRSRAHRAKDTAPSVPPEAVSTPGTAAQARRMVALCRATLEKAGRLDDWRGEAALDLAGRIERAMVDTGSAYAGLHRAYREAMQLALTGVGAAQSAPAAYKDEVAERRERRQGTG